MFIHVNMGKYIMGVLCERGSESYSFVFTYNAFHYNITTWQISTFLYDPIQIHEILRLTVTFLMHIIIYPRISQILSSKLTLDCSLNFPKIFSIFLVFFF